MEQSKKKKTIRTMSVMAVLIALTIIFSFVSFSIGGPITFTITFLIVAIGAIIYGPGMGAILGLAFGLMSFVQAATYDAFGLYLFSINPFYTFLVCVPTRVLMGVLVGIIYKVFRVKKFSGKRYNVALLMANISAPILNTTFFVTLLLCLFWNTDIIQGQVADYESPIMFVLMFVGLNFLVEVVISILAGFTSSRKLLPALSRYIGFSTKDESDKNVLENADNSIENK